MSESGGSTASPAGRIETTDKRGSANIAGIGKESSFDARQQLLLLSSLSSSSAESTLSRDIMGRIRIGDVDGVSELAGIDKKRAVQLARRYGESISGVEERKVLRTSDARKLERDVLSLIAEGASSKVARSKLLLLLAPTLNPELIRDRLNAALQGKQILDELSQGGRLDDLRKVLAAGLSFEIASPGRKAQRIIDSDTVRYFVSRKGSIKAVQEIISGFTKFPELASFFKEVDARALEDVLKILQGIEDSEPKDAESIVSDAEMLINQRLRKERGLDQERARRIVEEGVDDAVASLKMSSGEENDLRKAAFEALSIPFEFERAGLRKVVQAWNQRQEKEREAKAVRTDTMLRRHVDLVERAVERAVLLDQLLAVASAMEQYSLVMPTIGIDGMSFVNGRSLFLAKDQREGKIKANQAVSYSIGRTHSLSAVAKPRYVIMLTGANSGGKTTLLTTVATIHILTLLGLPVPCEKVEVAPLPIYLFRRRVTRKVGSLEQALSSLIPVFAERHRKLILMDEFEALTEPGAAGRILATIMNEAATTSSMVLLVTHLARETIPYVKLPIRVDGIEAQGLDKEGELIVDRQPKFNHIGSSTPKLIVMKLSQSAKKKSLQSLYKNILSSLESETMPVQTPLSMPWLAGVSDEETEGQE